MVESPMSPQAPESRSLPPLYLIEVATERLTIEVRPVLSFGLFCDQHDS